MATLTILAFILCWSLVLLGLVYLATEADLTKRWREAFGIAAKVCMASESRTFRCRAIRFIGHLVVCPKCVAGWLSGPAVLASVALFLIPWPWVLVYGFFVVAPPAGIGLIVLMTLVSPSSAVGVGFKEFDKRRVG